MAVKIRLMRIGTNRKPFYRVVAVDERRKRTGGYLELLGTYNPLTQPKEINLDQGKIDAWIKKGAVPSYGFLRIIGKAPQRAPRKAKKEKKEAPAPTPAPTAAETPTKEGAEATAPEAVAKPETSIPAGEETTFTPSEQPTEEVTAQAKQSETTDASTTESMQSPKKETAPEKPKTEEGKPAEGPTES